MNNSTASQSIGLPGILGVVFIVLKLTGVIHWSWWWVLAPFWLGFAVATFFVMVVLILAAGR